MLIKDSNNETILQSVNFEEIKEFDKFATIANNSIVVWRKLSNKLNYLNGENPNDNHTCPQPNAVTDTGFPACFNPSNKVFKVNSTEYNDGVKMRLMNR